MRIVCIGDCGVDRYVASGDRPGGITLNFAAHARRLFEPADVVHVVSAVGDDDEAAIVKGAIERLDVEVSLTELSGATSVQTIAIGEDGEKDFLRYEQGVLGDYRIGARERALLRSADLLVAPHFRQIDTFFDSVMAAPSTGLRAVDFADIAERGDAMDVRRFLHGFDVAFAALSPDDVELIDELDALARGNGKVMVVTLGAHGSLALADGTRLSCPAAAVERVVDTTGAGDTFAAGFLSAYCHGGDVARALERGAAEAARTVQRLGAY